MKELLKMIEQVDPDDTAKLDEIDARVWCWLNNYQFLRIGEPDVVRYDFYALSLENNTEYRNPCHLGEGYYYTRSRDALKAIRPEGWQWYASANCGMVTFVFHKGSHANPEAHGSDLPTEELAELHAIIQAIEWERTNG